VAQIRARWPRVKILLRAASGFARDAQMAWCEANAVDYVLGLARNQRLVGAIADDLAAAELDSLAQRSPARRFTDFAWRTLDSWSRERRVVAKAEHLPKGSNPRFVVTSLPASAVAARTLYQDVSCARGQVRVVRGVRLRPARGAAPDRARAHPGRDRDLRHHPAQAGEDRRPLAAGLGNGPNPVFAANRNSVRRIKDAMLAAPRRPPRSSLGARQAACPYQAEYHLAHLYLRRAAAF
jgi:hypothetical protein